MSSLDTDKVAVAPRRDLPRLTSLRAFAALSVFAYHMTTDGVWTSGSSIAMHTYVGVDFFFILSGFVITWSLKPGMSSVQFMKRRFARIYPSHLVVALICLVLPSIWFRPTPLGVATNLTLTQAWFKDFPVVFSLNSVSWSLSCEFFFYAAAPFVLRWVGTAKSKWVVVVLGAWFAAMATVAVVMGLTSTELGNLAYTFPVIRSGEFVLGIITATLALRGQLPRIPMWVPAVALAVAWALTWRVEITHSVGAVVFIIPCWLLVIAASGADLDDRPAWLLRKPWLVYAGQVSFTFYLVHDVVAMHVSALLIKPPQPIVVQAATLVGVFAVSALLAMALHHLVEKPAHALILGRKKRPTTAGPGAADS